ncbi:B-cell linker protein isoform X2 [Centropristis striata]|uniref:B-cell linker protein isoform X2 n=1 Tax=Centropristis striata TaxID=184440 RepID=UPI0027E08FF5|nr:B-cell linker protein isoform X2 [Centropristis striata]
MSFFGKLKNRHSGPPAPPRRTDDNAGFGWPQDEFDDEDGDMYEVPPCERPAVKVPQRQVEENVYLERTPNPTPPQRLAAPPPPRSAKLSKPQQRADDPKTKKPPEIDRNEKPGRKQKMPPPPVRSAPAPAPAANTEEDVYLDPNEEQDDNDDLYLEPTAACSPEPRGQKWVPPPQKTAILPSPIPMMKPPVPRAQSEMKLVGMTQNSFVPSLNDLKRVDARPAFNIKPPPPTPVKPPLPANLKEAKPIPPMPDTKPVAPSVVMRATKQSGNEDKKWFAGDCNRKAAEDLLMRVNKDGAFLIRHSSAQSARQPYTLAVLYQQKVYNIPIRFLGETLGYALGKEGKKNEEIFSTLDEMISHHMNNQLLLIDSKSQAKHTAYLTHPARP